MRTKTPLLQATTTWVHTVFRSLRKPARTNLALFLSALLSGPLDPTLSDLARRTPLPTLAQSRLNRLWRFLHHPTLQNPWTLTAHLLPLLAPRLAQGNLLPLLVDWTPGEDGKHQVLVAALPKGGRALGFAFALHSLSPFPSQNRVEEAFFHRLGREVQALGYVPLFLLDRGFDRLSLMRRLQEWGMGFLIRLRRNREVETETGERFLLGERYPGVPRPERQRVRLFGRGGGEVGLFLAQGKREPWYLAFWAPGDWEPSGYRLRVWIEEAFRDLKGRGFGLDRHGLRTEGSLRGWLWLLFLGMVLLVLLGAALRGREWWPKVVAHPERQSLFRLARLLLAQGPPSLRSVAVRTLTGLLRQRVQGWEK